VLVDDHRELAAALPELDEELLEGDVLGDEEDRRWTCPMLWSWSLARRKNRSFTFTTPSTWSRLPRATGIQVCPAARASAMLRSSGSSRSR
jgi:hypothetical protein